MSGDGETAIRRLGPGDEAVVRKLASGEPQTALLADDAAIVLAAFRDDRPVGFVLAYELPRRHGAPAIMFVYEVEVGAEHRRQGIARRLLDELAAIARSRGIRDGFVLTEPENEPANALYRSLGGERVETVMWDFRYADD